MCRRGPRCPRWDQRPVRHEVRRAGHPCLPPPHPGAGEPLRLPGPWRSARAARIGGRRPVLPLHHGPADLLPVRGRPPAASLDRWALPGQGPVRLPERVQTTVEKTGGYVAARLCSPSSTAPAAPWCSSSSVCRRGWPWVSDRLVAQFVPTIGTYLAIVLPVIVACSPTGRDRPRGPRLGRGLPTGGEPHARAEDQRQGHGRAPGGGLHLRLLGTALFGIAGALLAVPVSAVLLSLVHVYVRRHELVALDPPTEAHRDGGKLLAARAERNQS